MAYQIMSTLLLYTFTVLLETAFCSTNGVCYMQYVQSSAHTSYYTTYYSQGYGTKCGWLGWSRCTAYRSLTSSNARYHPTVYNSRAVCCSGYSGSPPHCQPICTPSCVHGSCTRPNMCSCETLWTGDLCRNDKNLHDWCSSITNHNINNDFHSNVRSSLKVYCGNRMSNAYTWYNASQTAHIAPLMEADSHRSAVQYRNSLYMLWMQHPYLRPYCCFSASNYHITLMQELIKFQSDFYNLIGSLNSSVAVGLRQELTRLCTNRSTDPFCNIIPAIDAIDVSSRLPRMLSEWTEATNTYKKAVLVSFAILKRKYPEQYASFVIDEDDIIVESTNIILQHIQKREVSQLRTFSTYLPPNDAYGATQSTCGANDRLCIFMKIVEQVRMYLDEANLDTNPIIINGKKLSILIAGVDYREFFRQKQLDRILTVLADQKSTSLQIANDLKQHTTTKFSELRSYFEKVETFNQRIASADIGYVNNRLQLYKTSVTNIVGRLKTDMAYLLTRAFLTVGLDIAKNTVILAMKIAEAFNPIKWLTGGSSVKDILDATAALANSIANLAKVKTISSTFNTLKTKVADIAEKIERNDNFLQNVKNLIERETVTKEAFETSKNQFIEQYTAYDPQITKPELAEVGSIWENLIDATCKVIDETTSASAASIKAIVNRLGLCASLKSQTAKLISTYKEMYDYQFDLINAMAAYVRSSVSLDAAKEISSEFTEVTSLDINRDSTLTTLAVIGGMSYVSYEVHMLQVIHLYCNVLEYMNGGIQPSACQGVNTDIALLTANTEPTCHSQTTHFYHVPTRPSFNNTNDMAYFRLHDLLLGDTISFKIPSADWLVENEWIHEFEKDDSFYVKGFEVYLPIQLDYPETFYVNADPVLHNEITPGSTEYIIIPDTPLIYEYTTGPSRLLCHNLKFKNPYTTCETSAVDNEVCSLSQTVQHHLYPSIYSQWSISVKPVSGRNMTIPVPATDLSIIVGMKLCKITRDEYNIEAGVQETTTSQCCPSGEYRPNPRSTCRVCPPESHSALAGYYCELD